MTAGRPSPDNEQRPLLLVTNDDGVYAPGLLELRRALEPVGEVAILAPEHNWSAAGHTKTMHKPLRVNEAQLSDGSPALVASGTPSDCVALALLGILDRQPDLVLSGINLGANVGHDLTYSGTVAAAMEAIRLTTCMDHPTERTIWPATSQGRRRAGASSVARGDIPIPTVKMITPRIVVRWLPRRTPSTPPSRQAAEKLSAPVAESVPTVSAPNPSRST